MEAKCLNACVGTLVVCYRTEKCLKAYGSFPKALGLSVSEGLGVYDYECLEKVSKVCRKVLVSA